MEDDGVDSIFQIGSGSSVFHRQGDGRVGLGTTANGAGLRVDPSLGNIVGTFVGDGSGLTGVPQDGAWQRTPVQDAIYPKDQMSVGIKNTNPNVNWGLHVGTDGTGANDLLVENIARFDGHSDFNSSVTIDGLLTSTDFNLNDTTDGSIQTNTLISNDIEVGSDVFSAKAGGGVAIGREDARANLDVDGSARFKTYYEVSTGVNSSANIVTLDLSLAQTLSLIHI